MALFLLALGYVFGTFLEYSVHWLLHTRLFWPYHKFHHDHPMADSGPTWSETIVIVSLIGGAGAIVAGYPFAIGFIVWYGAYATVHYADHHERTNANRPLMEAHDYHHMAECNYGVTTMLWDRLFGTFKSSPRR